MKKASANLLFATFLLSMLCGCSATYYANGRSGMPCADIPVIEPFTEVGSYKTRYFEREHDDSLTPLAHEAMLEVMGSEKAWGLGEVLAVSDTAEYEAIRQDVYTLLKNANTLKKKRDYIAFEPAKNRLIKDASLPASLLDYMKRNHLPYVMILLQNGFERHPDQKKIGYKWYNAKNFESSTSNGSILEMECLVADALQDRIYFYNMAGRLDDKPTDKEDIQADMHDLLGEYVHKNAVTQRNTPKKYLSYHFGYGKAYPSVVGTRGWEIDPDNLNFFGAEALWSISRSPLSVGFTMDLNNNSVAIAYEDAVNHWGKNTKYFFGPLVGLNKIVADRHLFSFNLGAGLVIDDTSYTRYNASAGMKEPGYDYKYYLVENASISYSYRYNNRRAIGIKVRAYSFNDWLTKKEGPKPFVPLWNVSLCWTTLVF